MKPARSHGAWFALSETGVVVGAARYGDAPEYQSSREAALSMAAFAGVKAIQVPNHRADQLEAMFSSLASGEPVKFVGFRRKP